MSFVSSMRMPLAFALALFAGAVAVQADEPGPGGTKTPKPVTGEQIFQSVCQACHMADAKGATGAATVPALAGNKALASSDYLVMMMLNGRGAMPSFGNMLDPNQMAAVATYIRTHFGNKYPKAVTPADVANLAQAAH